MRRFFICNLFVLPMLLISLYAGSSAYAESLRNSMLFKVTIIENGKEIEWEYENPNEYEVEFGNQVLKNEKAKRQIEALFNKAAISKTTHINAIIHALNEEGYEQIERLDVRWITAEDELYTWVWNKR
ncbi:hypothetical protein [Bacillus taeanensis]|uniref:PepSY domain-containing protein n=1 Tax=Bacillus taeanensis TaxID=273032 RepID=A0A366Y5I0_9BACI|nr:hypothetical protein [Bacillus taeanensis]RBW71471.1 hypothetical protein DS031_01610 [Bacillus taeanensis]